MGVHGAPVWPGGLWGEAEAVALLALAWPLALGEGLAMAWACRLCFKPTTCSRP